MAVALSTLVEEANRYLNCACTLLSLRANDHKNCSPYHAAKADIGHRAHNCQGYAHDFQHHLQRSLA